MSQMTMPERQISENISSIIAVSFQISSALTQFSSAILQAARIESSTGLNFASNGIITETICGSVSRSTASGLNTRGRKTNLLCVVTDEAPFERGVSSA